MSSEDRSLYDSNILCSHCLFPAFDTPLLQWYSKLVNEYILADPGSSIVVIQVTDLHVPDERSSGYKNIRLFNGTVLPIVRPDAVLVTGDMILGYRWKFISRDQPRQWELYDHVWKGQQVVSGERWLDLPGNHDFTMDGSKIAYHSSQGNASRVRLNSVTKGNQTVCFLGIDFSYRPRLLVS